MTLLAGYRGDNFSILFADSAISALPSHSYGSNPEIIERGSLKLFDFGNSAVAYTGFTYPAQQVLHSVRTQLSKDPELNVVDELQVQLKSHASLVKDFNGQFEFLVASLDENDAYLINIKAGSPSDVEYISKHQVVVRGSASSRVQAYVQSMIKGLLERFPTIDPQSLVTLISVALDMSSMSGPLSMQEDYIDMPMAGICLASTGVYRREQTNILAMHSQGLSLSQHYVVRHDENLLVHVDATKKRCFCDSYWSNRSLQHTADSLIKKLWNPAEMRCQAGLNLDTLRGFIILGTSMGFHPYMDIQAGVLAENVGNLIRLSANQSDGKANHIFSIWVSESRSIEIQKYYEKLS